MVLRPGESYRGTLEHLQGGEIGSPVDRIQVYPRVGPPNPASALDLPFQPQGVPGAPYQRRGSDANTIPIGAFALRLLPVDVDIVDNPRRITNYLDALNAYLPAPVYVRYTYTTGSGQNLRVLGPVDEVLRLQSVSYRPQADITGGLDQTVWRDGWPYIAYQLLDSDGTTYEFRQGWGVQNLFIITTPGRTDTDGTVQPDIPSGLRVPLPVTFEEVGKCGVSIGARSYRQDRVGTAITLTVDDGQPETTITPRLANVETLLASVTSAVELAEPHFPLAIRLEGVLYYVTSMEQAGPREYLMFLTRFD